MDIVANYYMVDDVNLRKFTGLSSEEVFNVVYDDERFPYCDIDKMWHTLYFLISKETDPVYDKSNFEAYSKSTFIFGDEIIGGDFHTSYISNENLKDILPEIEKLNFNDFLFNAKEFEENEIYPNVWNEDEELLLSELEMSFGEVKDFYKDVLENNANVLVIIC